MICGHRVSADRLLHRDLCLTYDFTYARSKHEDASRDRACLPGESYAAIFMSCWPEQVEEEGGPKDSRNENPREDVITSHADVAVVVLDNPSIVFLQEFLGVDEVAKHVGTC